MASKKKSSAPKGPICGNCLIPEDGSVARKLSACARCGLVAYCSRDCQKAHWKANHKQHCIRKADRTPGHQNPAGAQAPDSSSMVTMDEECAICLDKLAVSSAYPLPCKHLFHVFCVEELRQYGVQQACPLCRSPLQPGPVEAAAEATRVLVKISQQVRRGRFTWSTLPAWAKREMEISITGFRIGAGAGLAHAQVRLGMSYVKGRGVAQNGKEAVRWYRMAAKQGHVQAQYCLGDMFKEGNGVKQNSKEAVRWYKNAAEQGHALAQYCLGEMFNEGDGVKQNSKEAVRWYKNAAEQGHVQAQFSLGDMFERGRGVAQSYTKAIRWFRKAAEQGHTEAQFYMGYTISTDTDEDDAAAMRWLRKAAEQGHVDAQYHLDEMLEKCSKETQN